MAISFSLVDGQQFAPQAARVLAEAWEPPALHYTPAYLVWQLSFPSSLEMPSVAAYDRSDPVGFAGTSARSLRYGCTNIDVAVVSFVAVRRLWRNKGVAAGLYRTLLRALAAREIPVITYAKVGSAGERAMLRAYSDAGFRVSSLGTYSNYAFATRQAKADHRWLARFSEDVGIVSVLAERLSCDPLVLWSMPKIEQMAHYFTDPRPRKLIILQHSSMGPRGAGFVIQSELQTTQGVQPMITLDSIWVSSADVSGLPALLRAAALTWPCSDASIPVVTCPNLSGFDASDLRAAGVHRTGAEFRGYFCSPGRKPGPAFARTNLEVI